MRATAIFLAAVVAASASAQWTLTPATVKVPSSMRWWPFDSTRKLNVPWNSTIEVVARVGGARFMALAPNGDILVSQPWDGKIKLVRRVAGKDPLVFDFAKNLNLPHDIVFHKIGATTYIYVAETNHIARYTYTLGDTVGKSRQVIISGLPDSSLPELNGSYGHALKNIALDLNHKLYLSIASSSNAWPGDALSEPVRCAVYRYNADGTARELFATGIRNAEGLAFLPGTNNLWVAINNRDNIKYPYNDQTGWFGQEITEYIDNHPPDEFTQVAKGANYGWPYANPNPSSLNGMDFPPFDPDYDNNRLWQNFPRTTFTRISKGLPAHSAALGLTFWQNTTAPLAWRNGASIAFHGSWNRSARTGYKVVYFPWNTETKTPLAQADLVTGWLNDSDQSVWGRPVDTAVDLDGSILISDDDSGTIYRLKHNPPAQTASVSGTVATTSLDLNIVSTEKATDWNIFSARTSKVGSKIDGHNVVGALVLGSEIGERMLRYTNGSTKNRLVAKGAGKGFSFTVPAGTTLQTVKVYVNTKGAVGRLRAKLSDSADWVELPNFTNNNVTNGVATIAFKASSPNQRLTVNWTVLAGTGSIGLQAAAIVPNAK